MNIGGGEAADQMVRMMLSSGEVAVRLGGSALKNLLALSLALAKHRKTLSGKVNLSRMLRETRDLRNFPMTPEQYRQFQRLAKKQKILFSAIRDKDDRGKLIDVVMPVTEVDRASMIFERVLKTSQRERQESRGPDRDTRTRRETAQEGPERQTARQRPRTRDREQSPPQGPQEGPQPPSEQPAKGERREEPSKKDARWERDSPGTKASSVLPRDGNARTTSERPSVEQRLDGYRAQLQKKPGPARVKVKARFRPKVK